jgi:hypothetical protein
MASTTKGRLVDRISELGLGEVRVMILREDGAILFDNTAGKPFDLTGFVALTMGILQASDAVSSLVQGENKDGFRFSFDVSDSGVYALPIQVEGKKHYLLAVYHDLVNPGQMKAKLRVLTPHAESFAHLFLAETKSGVRPLFDNITDEEIDRLFSFAGN